MDVHELRELSGCSILLCKEAIEYSNGNRELAIAYIKAKTIAVSTGKMTFDERVKSFINN